MEQINIASASKEEIIKNAEALATAVNSGLNFLRIINREDAKEIINEVFINFINHPTERLYLQVANKEYTSILKDAVKDNLEIIISNLLYGKYEEDKKLNLSDYEKEKRNKESISDFMKVYKDLVYDNIDIVLNKYPFFVDNLKKIGGQEGYQDALIKNATLIIDKLNYHMNHCGGSFQDYMIWADATFLFELLDYIPEDEIIKNEELICEAINTVIKKLNVSYFAQKYDKEDNKEFDNALILNILSKLAKVNNSINDILNDNIEFIISMFCLKNVQNLKNEQLLDFFKYIFKQELEKQKLSLNDIKYFAGYNSSAAIIGTKIIKSGKKETNKVPYHKKLLQPVTRTIIPTLADEKNKSKTYDPYIYFEVYETVYTENISDNDVFEVFKELLEDNIFWGDAKSSNLGRLVKPNIPYVNDAYVTKFDPNKNQRIIDDEKKYYVDNDVVGLTGNRKKEVLGVGELVVIDIDCIYDFGNINLKELIERHIKEDEYFSANKFISLYFRDKLIDVATTNRFLNMYIREVKEKIIDNKTK